MAWTSFRLGRTACAAAYICMMLPIAPTGRLVAHVHLAFWCSVIEAVVQCPVCAITHLSERRLTPRVLRWLASFLGLLWSEVVCASAARWVHLSVAHASLSSSLAGASIELDRSRESPYGILAQGIFYLCIVQIAHGIAGLLGRLQATVRSEADEVMADAPPLYKDPRDFEDVMFDLTYAMVERLVYAYLAGQALLYGCLVHLFVNMALYLERVAAGTVLTALSNAISTFTGCQNVIFFNLSHLILVVAFLNIWSDFEDAHLDADDERRRQRAELRRGPPPLHGIRPRLPILNTVIPHQMAVRLALRVAWALDEIPGWLVPWLRHARGLGTWLCPEVAVMLSEGERQRLYAAALAGAPSSALAALWGHGPLRQRHIELWKRAGLTTGFVLLSETAIGMPGAGWAPSGQTLFLGKVATLLVRGVEAVFGVCVLVGGLIIVCEWL